MSSLALQQWIRPLLVLVLAFPAPASAQVDHGTKGRLATTSAVKECVIDDAIYENGDGLGSYVPPRKGDRIRMAVNEQSFQQPMTFVRDSAHAHPCGPPSVDLGRVRWKKTALGFMATQKQRAESGLGPKRAELTLAFEKDSIRDGVIWVTFSRHSYENSGLPTSFRTAAFRGREGIVESIPETDVGMTELRMRCE